MDKTAALVVLGLVQGAAEFLPISSSGHLVLLEQMPVFRKSMAAYDNAAILFVNVMLHAATLAALLVVMRRDILAIAIGFVRAVLKRSWDSPEVRIMISIGIASFPAAVVGITCNDYIEETFTSAVLACALLIINGLVLICTKIIPRYDRKLNEVGVLRSFVVGLFQAVAILPGISRSGMTITGGLVSGLEPMDAARFSFLMAIPVIGGATLLEGMKGYTAQLPAGLIPSLAFAMVVTFCAGVITLKLILAFMKNVRIYLFGLYTIAVGTIGIILMLGAN